MKNAEIKNLSIEDLKAKIGSESKALQSLKFAHSVSPIENPKVILTTRRLIARLQTELNARTHGEVKSLVESGDLNKANARDYLQSANLPTGIKLSKVKKALGKFSK